MGSLTGSRPKIAHVYTDSMCCSRPMPVATRSARRNIRVNTTVATVLSFIIPLSDVIMAITLGSAAQVIVTMDILRIQIVC